MIIRYQNYTTIACTYKFYLFSTYHEVGTSQTNMEGKIFILQRYKRRDCPNQEVGMGQTEGKGRSGKVLQPQDLFPSVISDFGVGVGCLLLVPHCLLVFNLVSK